MKKVLSFETLEGRIVLDGTPALLTQSPDAAVLANGTPSDAILSAAMQDPAALAEMADAGNDGAMRMLTGMGMSVDWADSSGASGDWTAPDILLNDEEPLPDEIWGVDVTNSQDVPTA